MGQIHDCIFGVEEGTYPFASLSIECFHGVICPVFRSHVFDIFWLGIFMKPCTYLLALNLTASRFLAFGSGAIVSYIAFRRVNL